MISISYKICSFCKAGQTLDNFPKHSSTKDGLRGWCRKCCATKKQQYKEKSTEKTKAYNWYYYNTKKQYFKDWYQRNKKRLRALSDKWRSANLEKRRKKEKEWRDTHKELRAHYRMMRIAKELQATPKWLTSDQIQEMKQIYKNRPQDHHVDHIIPLNGDNVSGLHVPWNLQYLPAVENMRKGNRVLEAA